MNILDKYEMWRSEFRMQDDGLRAFISMDKLERISFEVAMKNTGWIERVEAILGE